MDRNIDPKKENQYKDVLLKLLPGEIVAAFLVLDGIILPQELNAKWLSLGVVVVLLIMTPFYLIRIYNVKRWRQLLFISVSFIVWVYSVGGPFKYWDLYNPRLGSIFLILWTLLIPLVYLPGKDFPKQSVRITGDRPTAGKGPFGQVILFLPAMSKFLGKETTVMSIDRLKGTARLAIDKGKNSWALEWLEQIEVKA